MLFLKPREWSFDEAATSCDMDYEAYKSGRSLLRLSQGYTQIPLKVHSTSAYGKTYICVWKQDIKFGSFDSLN